VHLGSLGLLNKSVKRSGTTVYSLTGEPVGVALYSTVKDCFSLATQVDAQNGVYKKLNELLIIESPAFV